MGRRRSEIPPFTPITAFGAWLLAALISLILSAGASADVLDGVTAPVKEATAPVKEAVETVVPPVTAPAPAPASPPPVQPPKAKLPPPPVKAPAPPPVHAPSAPEAVTGTVTKAVDTATTAVTGVTSEAERAGEEAAGAAGATLGQTTQAGSRGSTAGAPGSTAKDRSDRTAPTAAEVAPAAAADPAQQVGLPARLLHPFIHVWPAVALTVERSLDGFVGHWSRSLLALFEKNGTGSLRGEGGTAAAVADSTPASRASDQPPFSWFHSPSLQPFNWISDERAFLVVILFTVLAAAMLLIVAAMRRELGLPALRPRGWPRSRD